MVKLSLKNSKLGPVVNVSLTPGRACVDGVPCAEGACYALKSYRMYKEVRAAWDHNTEIAETDRDAFFFSIIGQLAGMSGRKSKLFRWHVAGDILDREYMVGMVAVAKALPEWKFLAFTKNYKAVNEALQFVDIPGNLQVMFSQWPGLAMDNPHEFPVAWYDEANGSRCKAIDGTEKHCKDCQLCWHTKKDVFFPAH